MKGYKQLFHHDLLHVLSPEALKAFDEMQIGVYQNILHEDKYMWWYGFSETSEAITLDQLDRDLIEMYQNEQSMDE